MIKSFLEQLRTQRWADHRYYHHSRINQSLHFVSAISFMVGYFMMFFDPMMSALIGWLVSMTSRQAGHFFFEPRGYDEINQATHEHKEEIKVGYNLRRKVVLMTIWALVPVVLYINPSVLGLATPFTAVPFFWTEHYGVSLRYVGHCRHWDDIRIDGDPAAHDFIARYYRGGAMRASLACGRDHESLEDELALERRAADG